MSNSMPDTKRVQLDAAQLKNRFGDCSDVYADNRAQAAKLAGDKEEASHWEEVAIAVEKDEQ